MNAKTLIAIILVNCIIIAIVISTTARRTEDEVIPDTVKPETVAAGDYATDSVRVVMDDDLDFNGYMNSIKAALSYFNPADVQKFNEDNWRFIITRELDFKDSEYYKKPEDVKNKIDGFTNTKTKIIQVKSHEPRYSSDMLSEETKIITTTVSDDGTTETKEEIVTEANGRAVSDNSVTEIMPFKDSDNYVRDQAILGMCYFIDYSNGYLSDTDEYKNLIRDYPGFVEYRYSDDTVSANEELKKLPLASNFDYFAYSMRDYLINPEYMEQEYPGLYKYYSGKFPRQRVEVK